MTIRDTGWGVSPCIIAKSPGKGQLDEFWGLAGDLLYISAAPPLTPVDSGSSGTSDVGDDGGLKDERRTAADR